MQENVLFKHILTEAEHDGSLEPPASWEAKARNSAVWDEALKTNKMHVSKSL